MKTLRADADGWGGITGTGTGTGQIKHPPTGISIINFLISSLLVVFR
jgi:hypothetical protein